MGSVLLYLFLFMLSALMLSKSEMAKNKKNDIWFILAVLLPIILAAFRDHVGTDFINYINMYKRNASLSFGEWFRVSRSVSASRLGIWLISYIAGFFKSSEMFFAFFATFIVVPIALRLKQDYSKSICALCYFIYLTTFYATGLNMCKQGAAIGILFYGMKYVYERKFLKYILIVLIATSVHITAAIAIGIYFLYEPTKRLFTLRKICLALAAVCAIAIVPKILELMGGRFSSYTVYEGEISNMMFFLNLCWTVLFCILYKYYVKRDIRNNFLIMMLVIGTILELTGFYSPIVKRVALYYNFPQFLLIGQLPQTVCIGKNIAIMKIILYVYTVVLFVVRFYVLGHSEIIPYNFIGGTI